jgi:hypothetical protein
MDVEVDEVARLGHERHLRSSTASALLRVAVSRNIRATRMEREATNA